MEIEKIEARLRKVAKKLKLSSDWTRRDWSSNSDDRSIICPNGHMVGRIEVYRHDTGGNETSVYFPCFKCGEEVHVKNY